MMILIARYSIAIAIAVLLPFCISGVLAESIHSDFLDWVSSIWLADLATGFLCVLIGGLFIAKPSRKMGAPLLALVSGGFHYKLLQLGLGNRWPEVTCVPMFCGAAVAALVHWGWSAETLRREASKPPPEVPILPFRQL